MKRTVEPVKLDELERLATALVAVAPTRWTAGIIGTLGAGKTTFVQAIAAAAGLDRESVTSPTFSLRSTHPIDIHGRPLTLHHMDAYRVADEDEFLALGVEEHLECEDTWNLIEWADRVTGVMPQETLWIEIDPLLASRESMTIGEEPPRRIFFSSEDQSWDDRLQQALERYQP